MSNRDNILKNLQTYFEATIREHGSDPQGGGWNSQAAQHQRFAQLLKIHPDKSVPFTIIDYGCGSGGLVDYLNAHAYDYAYTGYDMTVGAVEQARKTYIDLSNVQFTHDKTILKQTDYVVGSGLFGLKFEGTSNETWHQHMLEMIRDLWSLATKGIAFNSLTTYSDAEYMRDELYYADPCKIFDFCKRELSRHVALLHDYDLYDFTILVRRDT